MKTRITIGMVLLVAVGAWAANELNVTANFNFQKNGIALQQSKNPVVTVSNNAVASGIVNVGTLYTAINFGQVSTSGYAMFINTTTNSWSSITFGAVSNVYNMKLKGGEAAVMRLNTNALGCISATNTVDFQYIILSD